MTQSIAQSKRPPEMDEPLKVVDINFGETPPQLMLYSVPEVELQRVHLVFKLKYAGEAQLTLKSKVQANPLRTLLKFQDEFPEFVRPQIVGAQSGLLLPFIIRLYQVQLDTLVDVIYTKRGVVVTFRNDPVKSVNATSSLDVIPGVSALIDGTVKTALAATFQEDVPEAVFKASSPGAEFPDPSFGACRAFNQFTKHTKFLELGLTARKGSCQPYNSLSLGAVVKHSIPSRVCLKPHKHKSSRDQVSVQDLIEMTPPPQDDVPMKLPKPKHKPHRRVIKLRQSEQAAPSTPILQFSESPVFESTPNSSPLREEPTLQRRHSVSSIIGEELPLKIRTASLQPSTRPRF